MMRTFHKMHGLGNDFAIFDARVEPLAMSEALARALADRHSGIGCDQLIVLEPSVVAELKMRIWNQDGGEVESCGNASRCVIALTGVTSFETDGGIVTGAANGSEVEVAIGEPRFGWEEIPLAYAMDSAALPLAWGELEQPMAINVGNPHLIFFVPDASAVPLDELGPRIEHDPAFPDQINVNVASLVDGRVKLRTFERGAGETLACGTGACATAVAAIASRRASSPVAVDMAGGSLTVTWAAGQPIRMRGAATHVFTGEIDLEALQSGLGT